MLRYQSLTLNVGATQLLEDFVFTGTPTVNDILEKYMNGMMLVLSSLCGIFVTLTQFCHLERQVESISTWQ